MFAKKNKVELISTISANRFHVALMKNLPGTYLMPKLNQWWLWTRGLQEKNSDSVEWEKRTFLKHLLLACCSGCCFELIVAECSLFAFYKLHTVSMDLGIKMEYDEYDYLRYYQTLPRRRKRYARYWNNMSRVSSQYFILLWYSLK